MRAVSGCVVTGHKGQMTASSMGNRRGGKSCTSDRERLRATGYDLEGPQKDGGI